MKKARKRGQGKSRKKDRKTSRGNGQEKSRRPSRGNGQENDQEKTRQDQLELFARCAAGFEHVLADELRSLGMLRVRPLKGGVAFWGTLADAYCACLWSRVATRVQLVLARVEAADADALYSGVEAFAWEDHVREGATVAVDAHGQNAALRNTKFTALKVKDALCDRLREVRGARPDVDPHDPDFAVDVALHERKATLYLNLSGQSLHRRGYRKEGVQTEAPLKETLAAGVLLAARWQDLAREGGTLVDPMCGSGTFSVEAALIAADVAPGLLRERWGFQGWKQHEPALWDFACKEARGRHEAAHPHTRIIAGDLDSHAVEIARSNARRAGIDALIEFNVIDASRTGKLLRRRVPGGQGLLVANPPYGHRLMARDELPQVYEALATAISDTPSGWDVAVITPDVGIDSAFGRTPREVIACYNGPIQTWVRIYDTQGERQLVDVISLEGRQLRVPVADLNSAQFASRLRKVARERARWARRDKVSCYRVYDADLPDYPVSVDLYRGAGPDEGRVVVAVEEQRRPSSVDAQRAQCRLADAVSLSAAILGVPLRYMVVREWQGERGGDAHKLRISEGGQTYAVDLDARVDALPLAMRDARAWVAQESRGKRMACLFASAGTTAVAAAAGGARLTVAVDTSTRRLDALRLVMEANDHTGGAHRFDRMDVHSWLKREAKRHARYDLVACTPPSWLPAKDAGGREWDLERDLPMLLRHIVSVLSDGGVALVFLANNDGMRIDAKSLARDGVSLEDATDLLTPPDFKRSRPAPTFLLIRPPK